MSNKVHPQIIEEVRRKHYQRQDYQPPINILTVYNCCPLCGTISQIDAREVSQENNPIVEVVQDNNKCMTCAAMSARYPEMSQYVRQIVHTQRFMLGLGSTSVVNASSPATPDEPTPENDEEDDGLVH